MLSKSRASDCHQCRKTAGSALLCVRRSALVKGVPLVKRRDIEFRQSRFSMFRYCIAVVLLLTLTHVATGAEKKRDWQMGKVLDSQRNRYFAGTVGSANTTGTAQTSGDYGTYQGNTSSSQMAVYRVYQTFLIEGETHAYLAQERLRWKWSKAANLTVNGPVKFAVEKRKLFVIDEDGKEHEMEIVKKVLRQPAEAPKQ